MNVFFLQNENATVKNEEKRKSVQCSLNPLRPYAHEKRSKKNTRKKKKKGRFLQAIDIYISIYTFAHNSAMPWGEKNVKEIY